MVWDIQRKILIEERLETQVMCQYWDGKNKRKSCEIIIEKMILHQDPKVRDENRKLKTQHIFY